MRSSQSHHGIDYIEWALDRPDSVRYDFAASDLASGVADGVPEVIADLPPPDSDRSFASLVAARYGADVSPENVLVTPGATAANALLTADAVTRAEASTPTVVTETPGYEPLSATPRALGADVTHVERPPETGYGVPRDALRAALDGTVCLVSLTNRHNPSGRLLSRERLESAGTTVSSAGSLLLVDEVYAPFVDTPASGPGTAFGGPTAAGLPATVVTNSLTKFFGLDSLRLGWLVGPDELVERLSGMQHHLLDVSRTSRYFGRVALHNAGTLAGRSRGLLRENAALLDEFVDGTERLTGVVDAEHSMAFLRYRDHDGDAVADAALDAGVRVAPGRFFGDRSRFRLSLSRDPSHTAEGLDVLGEALAALR